ncbi:hypothetical protein ABE85_02135 [Mitsuaria sp. 7]|nr:hypothetical protein ABE85_02135 [Mitsuaria sp. 7]
MSDMLLQLLAVLELLKGLQHPWSLGGTKKCGAHRRLAPFVTTLKNSLAILRGLVWKRENGTWSMASSWPRWKLQSTPQVR